VSGRGSHVVAVALSALVVAACLAGAATLPGVPQPEPLSPSPLEGASAGCAAEVVDDWADDGRVQGSYRLRCYRQALQSLPEDLRAYSTAPDDLERAMQSALHSNARTLAAADR
jgi:hypothetical protein